MQDSIQKARQRRAGLRGRDTDAYRLFDGEGDGLEGVLIDDYAGHWLVSTRDRGIPESLLEGGGEGCRSIWWKRLDQQERLAPERVWGEGGGEPFVVRENGISYWIDFSAGYSQGIFLDQRTNRARVKARSREGSRVLNTFAYTCAFGVVAAAGGAETTNIDLSKGYLAWGKENYELNGLRVDERGFMYGDAIDWLRRLGKRGETFDGVILDPPTFSRNQKGKVFRVESDYDKLVKGAAGVVRKGGWMLCCTNCRSIGEIGFEVMLREGMEAGGRGCGKVELLPMPRDFTGEKYLKSFWIDVA